MFNKSIVLALILCAFYLGVSQAANVLSALALPGDVTGAAGQITQDVQSAAGVGGSGLPIPGQLIPGQLIPGGGPQLPAVGGLVG